MSVLSPQNHHSVYGTTFLCTHTLTNCHTPVHNIIIIERAASSNLCDHQETYLITGVVIAVMGVIVGSSGFLFALTRSRRLVLKIQLCSEGIHAVG